MAETHNHAPHDYYVPTGPSDSPDVSGYLSQDSQGSINTFMSETFDAQSYPRTKTGKRGICEVEGCYGQAVMRTDDGCNCASLQGFWRCANHHFGHNGVYVVTGQTLRNMGWDGTSPLPNIHKTILGAETFEAEGENFTYEYVMGMIEDLSDDDYMDFCYEMDIDSEDMEELSSFVMRNYDSKRVMRFLKDRSAIGFGSEEGNAPVQDPMEFGEMANWTPLDGSEGLKRKRAEDDILNKYLSDDSPDQFTQQEYDSLISMNGYGDDNFDMAQAVLEIAGNRKRAEDDYDDYLFCEGCGEERKSVGPDSVFKIDNAREDVLDDGNVLCDRCHTRGYKIKRDAESFSAEYSGPSTLSSALSGARKTGRSGKHLTIVQRLVAKYGIDKGVKIYKHFGIKQKRASPKVRGKTRGTKSGPRRYSEGRVGGAGRSQVYQKGDRTGSWTPSGGHTTRFANSGKAWYQERGLGTPVAGPIPDTDLAGKAMGEKSRGSFVNPHGIVGYPFVPAQQRERKSKK